MWALDCPKWGYREPSLQNATIFHIRIFILLTLPKVRKNWAPIFTERCDACWMRAQTQVHFTHSGFLIIAEKPWGGGVLMLEILRPNFDPCEWGIEPPIKTRFERGLLTELLKKNIGFEQRYKLKGQLKNTLLAGRKTYVEWMMGARGVKLGNLAWTGRLFETHPVEWTWKPPSHMQIRTQARTRQNERRWNLTLIWLSKI